MHPTLNIDHATLAQFCQVHRIRRLALFGSQLKGTAKPESDIDLLVEFLPEAQPTLFDMARIEIELSEALGERKVDLRTPQDLSRYFRDEVVRTRSSWRCLRFRSRRESFSRVRKPSAWRIASSVLVGLNWTSQVCQKSGGRLPTSCSVSSRRHTPRSGSHRSIPSPRWSR